MFMISRPKSIRFLCMDTIEKRNLNDQYYNGKKKDTIKDKSTIKMIGRIYMLRTYQLINSVND